MRPFRTRRSPGLRFLFSLLSIGRWAWSTRGGLLRTVAAARTSRIPAAIDEVEGVDAKPLGEGPEVPDADPAASVSRDLAQPCDGVRFFVRPKVSELCFEDRDGRIGRPLVPAPVSDHRNLGKAASVAKIEPQVPEKRRQAPALEPSQVEQQRNRSASPRQLPHQACFERVIVLRRKATVGANADVAGLRKIKSEQIAVAKVGSRPRRQSLSSRRSIAKVGCPSWRRGERVALPGLCAPRVTGLHFTSETTDRAGRSPSG